MVVKQYDVVKASKDISDKVKMGCLGTVIHLYGPEVSTYLVEFVNGKNETIEILNVEVSDLRGI